MRLLVLLTAFSLVWCHPQSHAADLVSDVSQKIKEIDEQFKASQKGGLREAQKKREEQISGLIKEVEGVEPEKKGFAEYSVLADLYGRTRNWDAVIKNAEAALAIKSDATEMHVDLVKAHAEKGDLPHAEASFQKAMEQSAEKEAISPLRFRLYLLNRRADKIEPAVEQLSLFVQSLRDVKNIGAKRTYVQNAVELSRFLFNEGDKNLAIPRLDEEINYWTGVNPNSSAFAGGILRKLINQKIRLLAQTKEEKRANDLLAEAHAELNAALAANPDDVLLLIDGAELLAVDADIAPIDKQAAARTACLDDFDGKLLKFPSNQDLISSYSEVYRSIGLDLSKEERLDELQAHLKRYQEVVKKIPANSPSKISLILAESSLKNLVRRLAAERKQKELIGKPMSPLETDAWVNGSPQTADDLKGKVVLLDFWAVWCGPCRATFPHLTELHEKYKDDGLVVIGLTRYYQYGWDDAKKEHLKESGISDEKEVAAAEKFAAHHGLKHRLAFMPEESDTSENYAVSGIPHVVVIDRSGIIRLIRVGSGEKNAHDIEKMIEELINTKPTTSAAN